MGDELAGHEHGAIGAHPAHERLGARDLAARRPELGLEPDLDLACGQRSPEAALDELLAFHAVDDLLVELDVVDVVFRAYRRERVLGLLDDVLDVHGVARRHVHRPLERGAPDAGALLQVVRERHTPRLARLRLHRLAEAAEHARPEIHQTGEVVFVRLEQPGDLHEQGIDCRPPVLAVELLDVVEPEKAEVEVAVRVVAPHLLAVDEERLLGVQPGQKVGLHEREVALELCLPAHAFPVVFVHVGVDPLVELFLVVEIGVLLRDGLPAELAVDSATTGRRVDGDDVLVVDGEGADQGEVAQLVVRRGERFGVQFFPPDRGEDERMAQTVPLERNLDRVDRFDDAADGVGVGTRTLHVVVDRAELARGLLPHQAAVAFLADHEVRVELVRGLVHADDVVVGVDDVASR